jgi:Berberine and berberine like
MEVTFRAHPKVSLQTAEIAFLANGATSFSSFISILTQNANKWAADGWGGYISFGANERYFAGMTLFNAKLSLAEATTSMAPAMNFAKSFANGIALASTVTSSGSFYSTYKSYILPNEDPVGVSQSMASRLVPSSLLATAVIIHHALLRLLLTDCLQAGQKSVASALTQICDRLIYPTSPTQTDPNSLKYGSPVEILLVAPSSYTPFPGESFNDSSVTPAWRTSPWHVAFGQGFSNEADAATIKQAFVAANSAGDILRSISPNSGAYQNEADVYEPDPAAAFWGQDNYQKLLAIKAEVDPNNILTCHGCIGWDKWDPRFSCYPDIESS